MDEYEEQEIPATMIFESETGWAVVTFFGLVVLEGHA